MIFDSINTQETTDRGLIIQTAVQTEVIIKNNEFGQGMFQFFDSRKRIFETLTFYDLDEGFGFAIAFRPVRCDQAMANALLLQQFTESRASRTSARQFERFG